MASVILSSIGMTLLRLVKSGLGRGSITQSISRRTVTGYHWGMPGAGKLTKEGNGYAFTPVAAS